jgi:drug/metabolite transporter (DMT)-like permease
MISLTALVATLAAALFGGADFLGGFASRREPALLVTLGAQATGFLILAVATLFFPPGDWADPAILWGCVAGVSGGAGVLALYAGLATGRMSLVAPVTAALSGSIPAAFGLVSEGGALPWTAAAGLVLALAAVIIVSSTAEDDGHGQGRRAVAYGAIAGVCFAGSILAFAQTGSSTGLAPLGLARVAAVLMLVSAALVTRRTPIPSRPSMGLIALTGVLDSLANIAQVVAIRMGPLAVAAVLGALYPVATILLARAVLHERIHGWQRVGIALALVAVVLTALP